MTRSSAQACLLLLAFGACGDDEDPEVEQRDAASDAAARDAALDASPGLDSGIACALAGQYLWYYQSGFTNPDRYRVSAPDTLEVSRIQADGGPAATCSFSLPACGDEQNDVGQLNAALTNAEIAALFGDDPAVIAPTFVSDAPVLWILREADSKVIKIGQGAACDAGSSCDPKLTARVLALRNLIAGITQDADGLDDCDL